LKKLINILFFLSSILIAGNSPIIWSGSCSSKAFNLGSSACLTSGGVDPTLTLSTTLPLLGGGDLSQNRTFSISQSNTSTDGYLSSIDWNTFNNKAPTASPTFSGIPTAPTASNGTSSTQIATTAFVFGQGFLTSSGAIPTGSIDNATGATSATTTFVNALTTSVTLTQTAQIFAAANANFTTTTAASVAGMRITINGVASRTALLTLTALATNYLGTVQFTSALLAPGTYTVNFDFQRSSGTGTVNYASGTLNATGLQGTNSNGITQLTGDITAGPGSGSQAATIPAASITNAKISASAAIAYSKFAALTTGQIVAGNAGVPTATTLGGDATIGATGTLTIANSAITNAKVLNVDALKITTGTLPIGRGGTGTTAFANQRIPFSNGTTLTADGNFIYDTTNQRFTVGGFGTATGNFVVTSGSKTALQGWNQSAGNAVQASNQTAFSFSATNRSNSALTGASLGLEFGRGTLTTPLQALNGDQLGVIVANGYTGSQTSPGFSGAISFIASEDVTNTANGGELVLSTTPNTTLAPVERVRVTNDGLAKFKMGTTIDTSISQPTCTSAKRGTFWVIQGAAGIADILQICLKDASDNYNWVTK
jgi:hypothetical protein